jgi:thymidine kinase
VISHVCLLFEKGGNVRHHSGRIEVICGSMFCGKTEELIRRARRAIIARQEVQAFKPSLDDRYSIQHVTSHSGQNIEAQPIKRSREILDHLSASTTVVVIDEVQFFDEEIVSLVQQLATRGLRVIMAGLDMDFRGEPFGQMPALMAIAEEVTKLHAICMVCGEEACRTQRLVNGKPANYHDPVILVGAQEAYEARCREHHEVPR